MDADGIEIEEIDIVIVGAGICGLATALALHRKGIQSVVLERSETLRTSGIAIGILTNGWRALDQLGIGSKLRVRDIWLDTHKQQASPLSTGEARCVKRSDLIQMLAEDLPIGTIRFGCRIVSLKLDPLTSYPILQLLDGRKVKAKVLIGCDGVNSVVAEFLKLKPKKLFPMCGVRGLTIYPNGHGRAPEFVRTHRNDIVCGRIPINENLLFWFLPFPLTELSDANIFNDQELIKQMALDKTNGFPDEIAKMVEDCETSYLSLTHLRYRTPWDVLLGRFRNGTVTVAGDAMHVMGPFLGQGGSAALEDAIVLARCLAQKIGVGGGDMERNGREIIQRKVGEAIDAYVEERRTRLVRLSAQTYLTGLLLGTTLKPLKLLILALIFLLFRDRIRHTRYDCGRL
ncbi:monooxygenase 1-like isoform X1 [Ziziphus jujuba]|uniref:Monooxygenase 1-like isoform X1 n=1 Tax=Ziziphus jujuba TaxID=326968 RepID=A0ABM3ITR9_ZIZJJ|nr:monooxygenase 1-like isoform X1 [Ziziphus jujuba]